LTPKSFGYRYKPYGLRAIMLDSECTDFRIENEVILRDDGLGTDIGYTSSVLLDNGEVLITYYYYDEEDGYRYIAGTICREV
jgi:sialidase-1